MLGNLSPQVQITTLEAYAEAQIGCVGHNELLDGYRLGGFESRS